MPQTQTAPAFDPFAVAKEPEKPKVPKYDPTRKLKADDAWAIGKEFIDLDGLGTRAKPQESKEKPVYIKATGQTSGFVPKFMPMQS